MTQRSETWLFAFPVEYDPGYSGRAAPATTMTGTITLLLPIVFGVGLFWATRTLKLPVPSRIAFGVAAALGVAGPTYLLHAWDWDVRLLPAAFLFPSIVASIFGVVLGLVWLALLALINGLVAAMCLIPLMQAGDRVYNRAVLGFALGGILGGLLIFAGPIMLGLPSICAAIAVERLEPEQKEVTVD